ncbi:hypothetical protein OHA25_36655 [Nonomuraea sp. NBC_00507]|uniref:hypothetical protein n=1 Tax=Nonomuraea sp. NBC_00507 TaxID=2976002 RepID=UPI002E192B1A
MSEIGVRFPGETETLAERMVYATWVLEKRELFLSKIRDACRGRPPASSAMRQNSCV